MQLAALVPAVVNPPPAYSAPPDTTSAYTFVLRPDPNGNQLASPNIAAP